MFNSLNDGFTLSNGVKIPCVAYGTYKTPDGDKCVRGVASAIEAGYRHIDTAEFYKNEKGVGEGIIASGINPKDMFVTSKIWNDHQGYDSTFRAFERTMKKLKRDVLDLYLIHWPAPYAFRNKFPKKFLETWHAMEQLYKDGQIRAIGVCNCFPHHLKAVFGEIEVKPMVNQFEMHPGYTQEETLAFTKENGMVAEAWAPLCKGKAFGLEPLKSIAEKHGVSEAQVLVRWSLQKGALPLPKSVHADRIRQNADVFGFALTADEVSALNEFDKIGQLGSNPDTNKF